MELPYLVRLANRLAEGLEQIPAERRERHRAFILSRQQPDGGFAGREEGSDLYYTSFAVRGLAILGGPADEECERIAAFLKQSARWQVSVIDLVSWLYSALVVVGTGGPNLFEGFEANWQDRLAETLESFRRPDGGYAKTHEGAAGSTYHSFLVALCYELIDRPLPNPQPLIQFLLERQRDDGGFVEIAPMKRGGTNPTAAAVALLVMLGGMSESVRQDVTGFLADVKSPEGGFQANMRVPFGDSLSTFTALLTAQDLGLFDIYDAARVEPFISSLEMPAGGFRGASWDQQADVEYTFYALGTLGLLWSRKKSN